MTAKSSKHSHKSKVPLPAETVQAGKPWIAESSHRYLHIAVYVIGFLLCGFISLQLGQDNNWDLRNYHYYNPWAFLTGRIGFDFAPAQMQCYLNPLPDVLHYVGITYMPPKLYGFLMGGIHGLNIGLLFAIIFIVFRKLTPNLRLGLSLLCTAMGAYAPIFIGEIGATQNDTLTSLFVLAAVYLFVRVLADYKSLAADEARTKVILASLSFGFGVGLKLTLMTYALGAFAAMMVVEHSWTDRTKVLLIWCFAFLAGFLISNGFWMIKMYNQFGNPTFPFYNNIFESPWAELHSHSDDRWLTHSLGAALFRPIEIAFDNHYTQTQNMARDARYAIIYILLIISVLTWIVQRYLLQDNKQTAADDMPRWSVLKLSSSALFILVFFAVSYTVWQVKFSTIRYTAIAELFGPLLIVSLVYALIRSTVARTAVIALAFVSIVVALNPVQHERESWRDKFWSVQLPQIPHPENTIILMANTRPWGYLAPLFPPEIRWVRVKSNFTEPSHQTKMQSEIRRVLAEQTGDMYLLTRYHKQYYSWLQQDSQVLSEYNLGLELDKAMPIMSPYSRPGLFLIPVTKR